MGLQRDPVILEKGEKAYVKSEPLTVFDGEYSYFRLLKNEKINSEQSSDVLDLMEYLSEFKPDIKLLKENSSKFIFNDFFYKFVHFYCKFLFSILNLMERVPSKFAFFLSNIFFVL